VSFQIFFSYDGKSYTPKEFSKDLGVNPDNYITITSFTHHPFYEKFVLEIPDNWAWGEAHNLPISDVAQVLHYAINNGYSVDWGGDISDQGFSSKKGIAIILEKDWSEMSEEETKHIFDKPVPQKEITQGMRQEAFDNYKLTDDHGLHIVGTSTDQNGTKYFIAKNSWGSENGPYDGYLHVSEAFLLYKATSISLHKDAIPKHIAKKLDL